MDQSTIPPTDPEHLVWYKAIILFLGGVLMTLLGRTWLKHEKDGEDKDGKFERRAEDYAKHFSEIEVRLARMEARDIVTKADLHEIIDKVLDEVTNRFKADHHEIVKRVESCAIAINGRVDTLVIALTKGNDR